MGKLRITGGDLRGRKIEGPSGGGKTRPPLAKLRLSVFHILREKTEGAKVLDLFAGTGSFGIEALSRGASHVTFVEKDGPNLEKIRRNLDELALIDKAKISRLVLPRGLSRLKEKYDLAFCDPPFRRDFTSEILSSRELANGLLPSGQLILRLSPQQEIGSPECFSIAREHRIGDSVLWFLMPKSASDNE